MAKTLKTPPPLLEHCSSCSTSRNYVFHERGKHTREPAPGDFVWPGPQTKPGATKKARLTALEEAFVKGLLSCTRPATQNGPSKVLE